MTDVPRPADAGDMNHTSLVASRIVIRVFALVVTLGVLFLVYNPLKVAQMESDDGTGLDVGLAVFVTILMIGLGWGAVAGIWALIDSVMHGWSWAPIWLTIGGLMCALTVLVGQDVAWLWAGLAMSAPIGLGLLLGGSIHTLRNRTKGTSGQAPLGAGA